jgi:hypothetical protein
MSHIDSKIANGDYTVKITYPQSPSKPTLPIKATPAQHREYADKLEAYEAAKAQQRVARDAYYAEQNRLEKQFREDLEEQYGMKGHPKADKLFSKAWQMGHSNGYGEVANYYDDLHELVA